jgi:hypothetical protein
MKSSHARMVVIVVLTFAQAAARTPSEADNNQPKITSGIANPSLKV